MPTSRKVSSRVIALRYKGGEPVTSIVRDTGSYDSLYRALREFNIPLRVGHRVSHDKLVHMFIALDDAMTQQDWSIVQQVKDRLEEVLI